MKQDAHEEKLVHQRATLLWTAPSPSPLVESVLVSPLIATLFGNLFRAHTNQYMARRGFIVNLPGVPLRLLRGSHLSKSLVAPLSTLLFISTPLYWSMPHDRSGTVLPFGCPVYPVIMSECSKPIYDLCPFYLGEHSEHLIGNIFSTYSNNSIIIHFTFTASQAAFASGPPYPALLSTPPVTRPRYVLSRLAIIPW